MFGEAPTAAQPTEGAFDDPALGQHHEPLGGIGALDDFQVPGPELANRRCGGGPLVAAIGEHPHDKGKEAADLFEDWQRPIAILNIGGLDVGRQDQAERVDDDVAFLAFDLFTSVVARRIDPRPPFSAPLTL